MHRGIGRKHAKVLSDALWPITLQIILIFSLSFSVYSKFSTDFSCSEKEKREPGPTH